MRCLLAYLVVGQKRAMYRATCYSLFVMVCRCTEVAYDGSRQVSLDSSTTSICRCSPGRPRLTF